MEHNTTAAELEKLLAETTPGPWFVGYFAMKCEKSHQHTGRSGVDPCHYEKVRIDVGPEIYSESGDPVVREFQEELEICDANARLIAMSPTLARKVIAAEKLAEVLREIQCADATEGDTVDDCADMAFIALAEWGQAQ